MRHGAQTWHGAGGGLTHGAGAWLAPSQQPPLSPVRCEHRTTNTPRTTRRCSTPVLLTVRHASAVHHVPYTHRAHGLQRVGHEGVAPCRRHWHRRAGGGQDALNVSRVSCGLRWAVSSSGVCSRHLSAADDPCCAVRWAREYLWQVPSWQPRSLLQNAILLSCFGLSLKRSRVPSDVRTPPPSGYSVGPFSNHNHASRPRLAALALP